ncbi:MAG: hypothetical protein JHC81_06580 [Brevundimonas sp.]|jgi:hypothetical protein|uniref:hypothetical protein n=1 Tax=Brevundimonas sp. TaxID=1871086 RepID=UPI001A1FDF93|nr:hypothetical protein [Brevundimonas sp.]MBJ7447185.1 hypothetical protein [Brevundimonas sp.]
MTLKPFAAALAAVSLLSVAACATPSRPEMMVLPATTGLTASSGDLGYRSVTTVNVSGGEDTNPLWTSQVSNEDLKTALEQSLEAAGYMGSSGPPMTVTANMIELNQPMMGLDLSVTSRIQYQVTSNGRVVFNDTVAATGTATMGDAFAAVERLRIANEKSIKENIKQFLTRFRATAR